MTMAEAPQADISEQHPALLGDILRKSFAGDYHMDLQFELISLMLILAHETGDDIRSADELLPARTSGVGSQTAACMQNLDR